MSGFSGGGSSIFLARGVTSLLVLLGLDATIHDTVKAMGLSPEGANVG
jgi:hypothetical protein